MSDLSLDTDQTALLNEILLAPSHKSRNDRFDSDDSAGRCSGSCSSGTCAA